jgi:hypothetical protein
MPLRRLLESRAQLHSARRLGSEAGALCAGGVHRRHRAADVPARSPAAQSADRRDRWRLAFHERLLVLIMLVFLAIGAAYGIGAKTITSSVDGINAVTKTFAGLSGLVFLLFVISQFLACFNYSNMATIVAVNMGDALEHANLGTIPLMLGFITVTGVVGMLIVGAIPKWALLAPIFVPLLMRLGVAPEAVMAAYRVADSPPNIVTPLMPYFALIVVRRRRCSTTRAIDLANTRGHIWRSMSGSFQADAYGGYTKLYEADREPGPLVEAACWVHARRPFFILADVAAQRPPQGAGQNREPGSRRWHWRRFGIAQLSSRDHEHETGRTLYRQITAVHDWRWLVPQQQLYRIRRGNDRRNMVRASGTSSIIEFPGSFHAPPKFRDEGHADCQRLGST